MNRTWVRTLLPVLLIPALTAGGCGENPLNPCTYYDAAPIIPPTGAVLVTDTVDARVRQDQLFVRLEGYVADRGLDRVFLDLHFPDGYEYALELDFLPAGHPQAGIATHAVTWLPAEQYVNDPTFWQTGTYQVASLAIERLTGSCGTTGDEYLYWSASAAQLGMIDTTFVLLME